MGNAQTVQLVLGSIWSRYHVRVWSKAAGVSVGAGSAHHEYLLTLGGGRDLLHRPDCFDNGRDQVKDDLTAGDEASFEGYLHLSQGQRLPQADGRAAVVQGSDDR
jgi:hypothetical protein